jgi:hypothetical protein
MIAPKTGHLFSAADAYFALPPCETGIPAAYLRNGDDSSSVSFGAAKCCLFKYDRESKRIIQLLDGVGIPTRAIVYNETGWTVNHLVKIAKHKNGTWVVDKGDIEQSKIWRGLRVTTTGTTTSTTPNPVNLPCQGYCLWTASASLRWEGPVGGCENRVTTTLPPPTTPPPPPPPVTTTLGPTTTVTTTAATCLSAKPTCKLKCVAVTTTSGAWPPAPSTGLTYQLENSGADGCSSPCTCYGQGDPCFTLNAYIESRCIFMVTTTSTTTTTESPSNRQNPCFQVDKFAPTASIPANTFRAARLQGGIGPWQVCKECDPGYRPLYPIGAKPPVLPSESATAVYHQSSCVYDPCSSDLPLPGDYLVGKAVYRAFNWDNLQTNWQNALDSADFLRFDLNPGPSPWSWAYLQVDSKGDGYDVQGLELPGYQNSLGDFFNPPDRNPLAWYAPNWSICQSCPPGTRPKLPPPRMLPMDTSWWISMRNWAIEDAPVDDPDWGYGRRGIAELFVRWGRRHGRLDYAEGTSRLWKWETPCVPGYDCNLCNFAPAWREMYEEDLTETTQVPTTTVTTTTTTGVPCGCMPPGVCPDVAGECVRTECVPGGARTTLSCPFTTPEPGQWCYDGIKYCNCDATTTTATTTTTVSPECGQCRWVHVRNPLTPSAGPNPLWYPLESCGAASCNCTLPPYPVPPQGCSGLQGEWPPGSGLCLGTFPPNPSCGATYSVSCHSIPAASTAPPCSSCSGTCVYYSMFSGNDFIWIGISCPPEDLGNGGGGDPLGASCCKRRPLGCTSYPCVCSAPSSPPTNICQITQTSCSTLGGDCACCNTTGCQRKCSYKGNGYGGWTKIADPCPTTCPCPGRPLGQSQSDCDRIDFTCGEIVPTNTSTSTTTGTGTTTSTTTVGPGACCWPGGTCTILDSNTCVSSGGSFQGAGTVCSPNPCPTTTTTATPLGRCCYPSGGCNDNMAKDFCEQYQGGTWTVNATCGPFPYAACGLATTSTTSSTPAPLGACCCYNEGTGVYTCTNGNTLASCQAQNDGIYSICSWNAGATCLAGSPPYCGGASTTTTTTATVTLSPCAGTECSYQSLDGVTWSLMSPCGSPCNCPTPQLSPAFAGDVAIISCVSP